MAEHLGVTIGLPAGQTTWEYLVILLALEIWAARFRSSGLLLLGDNLGALEGALNHRGRGDLSKITRELSWRQVRQAWLYAVAHLPSEANVVADRLSRLHAPAGSDRKSFPPELSGATRRIADPMALWICS